MNRNFLIFLVGAMVIAMFGPAQVWADQATFALENNAWDGNPNLGTYGPASGSLIDYELFVQLDDIESDGFDSQGLEAFGLDILTNTGVPQSALMPSPTMVEEPLVTIFDDLWSGGKAPSPTGGFGMGFIFDLGFVSGDDVFGADANMSHLWDADSSAAAGVTPPALAGIGIGTPGVGTLDTGGNPFPYYGTARAKWYLMRGQIDVPDAPGDYVVDPHLNVANVIRLDKDLNVDQLNGYVDDITFNHSVVQRGFSFTVTPEPATASLILFAGGLILGCRRRRGAGRTLQRAGIALALAASLLLTSNTARADHASFVLENNAWNGNANLGVYPAASGATIDYELYVSLVDAESDGLESQGLAAISLDILTNTGIAQPILDFSPTTNEYSSITVMDELWSGGPTPIWVGGFGLEAATPGVSVGDDILGASAIAAGNWVGDTSAAPGTTPKLLAGIGFGVPTDGVFDTGGNPFPYYGTARSKWYLLRGQITVPAAPGSYSVEPSVDVANVIVPTADLNADVITGFVEDIGRHHSVTMQGFTFTVTPEPAALSVLLLGAAVISRRRH